MKTMILIPALAPDKTLIEYVKALKGHNLGKICIIDDGSGEKYSEIFSELEAIDGCVVLRHDVNRGKGAALKTGFKYFLNMPEVGDYNGVISADSDGQHTIEDIVKIAALLSDKTELILGVRDFTGDDIPPKSRFGNNLTSKIMKLLYHVKISDTQTGLRAFPNALISQILECKGDRYEYETNMLIFCATHKIPIIETPIQTVYFENNAGTHFHPVKDSIRIYSLFFGTFTKYIFSSLSSSVIDIAVFQLMLATVFASVDTKYIFIATAVARVISSFYNFMINRFVVFSSKGNAAVQTVKYYVLVVVQMLCSAGLVAGVTALLPNLPWLNKLVIDTLLFFCSYMVQKKFIFKK